MGILDIIKRGKSSPKQEDIPSGFPELSMDRLPPLPEISLPPLPQQLD